MASQMPGQLQKSVYLSYATTRQIFTKLSWKWWNCAGQQNGHIDWPSECRSRTLFTEIISHLLLDRFQPNFHQNDAISAGNNSVISADLENVCQDHISEERSNTSPIVRLISTIFFQKWCRYRDCRGYTYKNSLHRPRKRFLLQGFITQISHLVAVLYTSIVLSVNAGLRCIL